MLISKKFFIFLSLIVLNNQNVDAMNYNLLDKINKAPGKLLACMDNGFELAIENLEKVCDNNKVFLVSSSIILMMAFLKLIRKGLEKQNALKNYLVAKKMKHNIANEKISLALLRKQPYFAKEIGNEIEVLLHGKEPQKRVPQLKYTIDNELPKHRSEFNNTTQAQLINNLINRVRLFYLNNPLIVDSSIALTILILTRKATKFIFKI